MSDHRGASQQSIHSNGPTVQRTKRTNGAKVDIIEQVRETISRHEMLKAGDVVVVAVSGGPDSVALFHLLWRLRLELDVRLHIAHLNHCLRGQESDDDLEFVTGVARQFDCDADLARAHRALQHDPLWRHLGDADCFQRHAGQSVWLYLAGQCAAFDRSAG